MPRRDSPAVSACSACCDDALVEALAAHGRVEHVAGQEVDEVHGPFPVNGRREEWQSAFDI